MSLTIIVGGLGGEPKGKIVAYLALADQAVLAARVSGDTPHSVEWNGQAQVASLLSCAFVQPDTRLLVGPGATVNVGDLLDEIERLGVGDRVGVDPRCLVQEGRKRAAEIAALQPFLTDVPLEFSTAARNGRVALLEGSRGLADSPIYRAGDAGEGRDTTAQQGCVESGVGPTLVTDVYVVMAALNRDSVAPAVETPIGMDPAPSDFDLALARAAILVNGATGLVLSDLQARVPRAQGAQRRSHLPTDARQFIDAIEAALGVPIVLVSTGPAVEHIVDLR